MNLIKNLTTFLVSLVLSFIVAEAFFRFFYPQNLTGTWSTIDKFGLLMNKSEGEAFQRYGDRKARYDFQEFGIRRSFYPQDSTLNKVLVLGDSFTFGWLLNEEDTYINLLAKANDNKIFLNAATGGWGVSHYTAYVETYCERIKPEIILVVFNADDIYRMLRSNLYIYDPDLKVVSRSEYKQTKKHHLMKLIKKFPFVNFILENSHLFQFVRLVAFGGGLGTMQKKDDLDPWKNVLTFGSREIENINYSNQYGAALIQYLKKISTKCNSDLRMVYTGVQKKNNFGTYPSLEFIEYAKDKDFFNKLGIKFVDLSDTSQMVEYRRNPRKHTIKYDNHPNESGAKLLFEAINQSNILRTN